MSKSELRMPDLKAAACCALLLMNVPAMPAQQPAPAQQGTPAPAQTPAATQQAPGAQRPATTPSPTQPAAAAPVENSTLPASGLPAAPTPALTEPLFLRDTDKDYTQLKRHSFRMPFAPYTPTEYAQPRLSNTPRLDDLLRDGKLYLSLSDAVTLALENNYDIAIARINLDIADTDILRTRAGSSFRGVSTGLVTNTLGGASTTIVGGGGPGGTSSGTGGAGAGTSGLVLSTNGGGPQPYLFDPQLTGTVEFNRAITQATSDFSTGGSTNTYSGNFGYVEGFSTGTQLSVTFNNQRISTTNNLASFSPEITSSFQAQITQHLLQGFGTKVNRRFIIEARNNRRITDSSFRQQLLYTINQIENIYWSLVSAYEDEQAKERSLEQSTQLTADNRKQLEIGTLAPLDVVNSDSAVATDKQALITSKSNLEYQQLLMKQAIARNLDDPQLANAPVVPTDRVALDRLPEEGEKVEDLVKQAYTLNPQVEQAVLSLENNRITIAGEKNGLLPIVDLFGFYGDSAVGGAANPGQVSLTGGTAPTSTIPVGTPGGYPGVLSDLFKNDYPNYAVGVNVSIPLRNRVAQADQARSQMEYRQTQMRLQQLYTQIKIQVINAQYALTNDRANVQAAQTARDFEAQSLAAEQKKYKLGASTTANVLQQERNLAIGENNLIGATAAYAKDRAALEQILASTLDTYGISLVDAASGKVTQAPMIPGLTAPKAPAAPKPLSATPPPAPGQ